MMKTGGGWESWVAPLLIAVLSGIVATSPHLQPASRTPNTTAARLVEERPSDYEPIYARAWEDPLLAVSDSTVLPAPADVSTPWRDKTIRVTKASVDAIAHDQASADRLTIIMQELVSGPGLEDEESRRQERLATTMGLERAGFSPDSAGLIRIRVERPVRSGLSRFMAAQWFAKGNQRCLLVFVPDGLLDEMMSLPRLRSVAEQILERISSREPARVKIFRRNSGGLIEDLAWAAVMDPSPARATWDVINTGSTVSLRAVALTAKGRVAPTGGTAAGLMAAARSRDDIDRWFSRSIGRETVGQEGAELLQPLGSWRLGRVLNSDRNLVDILTTELRLRRRSLDVTRHAMAVVCESDSPYGAEFAAEFRDQVESGQVRVMNFMSGLDIAPRSEPGRTAYQRYRDEAANLQRAGISMQPTTPVGPRHVDYVYRQLEFYQRDLVSQGRELSAVLICAYDQYDKRPLIQLIRDRFPDTLVMTTDLHASLTDASDYEIMRNVVVASHLGLRVSQDVQAGFPPFRSCYQTAMFLAAIHAVGPFNDTALGNLVGEMDFRAPRGWVYEIGQGVAVALPMNRPVSATQSAYVPSAQQPAVSGRKVIGLGLALVGSAALCVLVVALLARRSRLFRGGEVDSWQRAVRLGMRLLVATALYAAVAALAMRFGDRLGEPWGLIDGVSAWPSELLRFAAILLGAYFFWICWSLIRHRLVEAAVAFSDEEEDTPGGPGDQRGGSCGVAASDSSRPRRLKWVVAGGATPESAVDTWLLEPAQAWVNPATETGNAPLTFKQRWRAFLRAIMRASVMGWSCPPQGRVMRVYDLLVGLRARTLGSQIWIRLAVLGLILVLVGSGLLLFLGVPMVPVRGVGAYNVHLLLMIILGAVLNGLVLLVLDAGHTCNRFVNLLSCRRSLWPKEVRDPARRATGIDDSIIDSWLDVRATARTTAVVNSLIYFPIGIILLAAVAWHRSVDAWPHSALLIVLYGLSMVLCVVVGWSMRRSAERVRQIEVDRLKSRLAQFSAEASPAGAAVALVAGTIEEKPVAEAGALPEAREALESAVTGGDADQQVGTKTAPVRVAAAVAAASPAPAPLDRSHVQALIERIEAVKEGAFAPWRDDPIVRGLVLPLVGVLSVKFAEWLNAAIHQA
ncbi:MAG: hypothetical protein GIKADHBN_00640 [Phycisphaerales bacterium]|nr:hypothetical protein [Phycisphaerales bacterium]